MANDRPGTYNLPLDYRITSVPAPEAGSNPQVTFTIIYYAIQQILRTFVQFCGVGPRSVGDWAILAGSPSTLLRGNLGRLYVQASETIAANALISLHNAAGALRVRNANATNNTRPADGYCSTENGILIGAVGEVVLSSGVISDLVGLVVGQRYYLTTANGQFAVAPAVAAGNIEQYIGIAITTTDLYFNTAYWIQH
jgi:hypothetical protein